MNLNSNETISTFSLNYKSGVRERTVTFEANPGDVICVINNYKDGGACSISFSETFETQKNATIQSNQFIYSDECHTTYEVTYDDSYQLIVPVRENYTFLGWYRNGEKIADGIWNVALNLELTAVWKPN